MIKILVGGAPVFNWHEIRKRKRKGSKTRPHSSPDPSCGREESRGGAIPFPQKNSLPRRVQISFQDFRQKMFELRSKNTALTYKTGELRADWFAYMYYSMKTKTATRTVFEYPLLIEARGKPSLLSAHMYFTL